MVRLIFPQARATTLFGVLVCPLWPPVQTLLPRCCLVVLHWHGGHIHQHESRCNLFSNSARSLSLSPSLQEIRDWPLPRRPRHLSARNGARSKSRKRKEDPPRSFGHSLHDWSGKLPLNECDQQKVNGAKSGLDSREIKALPSHAREADPGHAGQPAAHISRNISISTEN